MKVIIIDRCEYCDSEAYLCVDEYKDDDIERPIYQACQACKAVANWKWRYRYESLLTCLTVLYQWSWIGQR